MSVIPQLALLIASLLLPGLSVADPPTGWTTGGKSLLIIPVGFTDAPAPAGPAGGWTNAIADLNAFYVRQSYSNYWIKSFAISPAINLAVSATNYKPYSDWQGTQFLPDIRTNARVAGYDTDDYDLEIVHTWMPGEAANGIAIRGKGMHINFSNNESKITLTIGHELGHNLGLFHNRGAGSSSYLPGTYQKNDYWLAEYGGYFDVMGSSDTNLYGIGEFCAFYKYWLGWMPDSMIVAPATSGTFRIHAFDQGVLTPGNAYALKIQADESYSYWCEFRQAVTNNEWSMNGLGIYWGGEALFSVGRYAYQLDMTSGSQGRENPGSRNASGQNMADAPLMLGKTFTDENADLHITPIRKAGTSPEALDVVVHRGDFPGNEPPTLSLSASTQTPATGQVVVVTATASDPNGDALAYYWEFDDPYAPADAGLRPFGVGYVNPDATLRSVASNLWPSNCHGLIRCSVTDMKGGTTIASLAMTVGGGAGYTITGVVRDEFGNPLGGAVVNNLKLTAPTLQYSSSNFAASGETGSNGYYMINVRNGLSYNLQAHHKGHTFVCNTPGGTTTGVVSIAGASVTNVNFTRTNATRMIGGPVYLAGSSPTYDPAIHGAMSVQGGTNVVNVGTNGYWLMNVPEGPIALSFNIQPGHSISYGFRNPYEVIESFTNLATFVDISNAVARVGFPYARGTSDETISSVDIPVVLNLPVSFTNASWGPNLWLAGILGGDDTAVYGEDYRMLPLEVKFKNYAPVRTNYVALDLLTNSSTQSRIVTLTLEPMSVSTHMGAISTYTHAIIPNGADGDADGLPDAWEWAYGNSFTGLVAAADDDSDGVANMAEYLADTSPLDGQSRLGITGIQVLPGAVQIAWAGGSNAWQYLEYRSSLSSTSLPWTVLYSNAPPTAWSTNVLTVGTSSTSGFYRVRVVR